MSTRINASTFFITGNANNGVLIQLAACGIMVALLTGAPSLTFWRFRFQQYTNFAMLYIVQSFEGQVAFGETTTARVAVSVWWLVNRAMGQGAPRLFRGVQKLRRGRQPAPHPVPQVPRARQHAHAVGD